MYNMLAKTKVEEMVGVIHSDKVLQHGLPLSISFAERKSAFLYKLKSPSDESRYKRYTGTPIRYAGGKSLAVGLIIERIPNGVQRVISPFLGGGSVEVACAIELDLH